jgi:hypothetical protein
MKKIAIGIDLANTRGAVDAEQVFSFRKGWGSDLIIEILASCCPEDLDSSSVKAPGTPIIHKYPLGCLV